MKKLALLILAAGTYLIFQPHFACAETAATGEPFGLENVVEKARELAGKPFQPPPKVPEFLRKIDYDQWRDIRFRPEKALWRTENLPFQVQFFHPGFLYDQTVIINVVAGGKVERLNFSPDLFSYGLNDFKGKIPADLGFAGFRLHYPLNPRNYYDEVAVFLGASYFRAVGKGQVYGLSARALAINTAVPAGEEFPFFKEFWLQRPAPKARQMIVYALIDSPSASGAYRFVVRPGEATIIEVAATVFLRKPVQKLGIAPLTSMFFYGENTNLRPADDFRPEVHDSDGLLIATAANEWIWRPLENPPSLLDTSFQLNDPKVSGSCQRDRNFDHYQDLEADFQLRPSAWITPARTGARGRWNSCRSRWTRKPTTISFLSGSRKGSRTPCSRSPFPMRYAGSPPAPCRRAGLSSPRERPRGKEEQARRFLVDFAGGKLESLGKDAKVEAMVSVGGGKVTEQHLEKNAYTGGWRLSFEVLPDKAGALGQILPEKMKKPLEMRALLRQGDEVLTETWSYVVFP